MLDKLTFIPTFQALEENNITSFYFVHIVYCARHVNAAAAGSLENILVDPGPAWLHPI